MDKNKEVPPEEVSLNIHSPDSKTKDQENPLDNLLVILQQNAGTVLPFTCWQRLCSQS
ncbi:hypothetical protein TSAR_011337 [Trichomalopsis sarcophagae]|uniref:Uncharacterized protein n=1 Tax=Trichomalopsis sarcophagae TaxID=543379 RepID=A0A232FDJ1_9HYME|nr:hypothetical protein TSAR_011337 [Trichomalopsis sarcophagae]